ncbi:MAG: AAA family ATPase [Ruminococcus sp.]|jgi:ABC-type Na+ transport system ATPase subunit NatA|nr:AAA family ATPase [Ruminococcus sp.]
MINSVSFNNFRGLDDIKVPLSRLTMLTGSNGVGKTSVLEGLYCLFAQSKLNVSVLSRYNKAVGLAIHQIGNATPTVSAKENYNYKLFWDECPRYGYDECSVTANDGSYSLKWSYKKAKLNEIDYKPEINPYPVDSTTAFAKWEWILNEDGSNAVEEKFTRAQVLSPDGGLYFYPLYPVKNECFTSTCEYLDFSLIRIQAIDLSFERSKELTKALQIIEPRVTDVRMNSFTSGLSVVLDNEIELSLGALGNGTVIWLSTVALIKAIIDNAKDGNRLKSPMFILIDEIGAGIHYSIMKEIWKYLNELSAQYPFIQFVFTSHSDDCIRAYCEAFADSDEASIVRMHRTFNNEKIVTTEYKKELFPNIIDGKWEVRG